MIVHKRRVTGNGTRVREGWYLFGIIPLFIRVQRGG